MNDNFYKTLMENLYDGVYYVDGSQKILFWNKSAEKITGYSRKEVLGAMCSSNILRHLNDAGIELCTKGCPLRRTLQDGETREADVYLHHKKGHRVPVSVRVSPIFDEQQNIIGASEIFSENSKQILLREELEKLKGEVLSDTLTGIGNRKFAELTILSRLNALTGLDIAFGCLFFDIDDFKRINDKHGHNMGDAILKMVSKTVVNIVRSLDSVCRWAGDEFVVILPNINKKTLATVAEKIRMFIEKTWIEVNTEILNVTISVGGTMAKPLDDIASLIQRADAQMYQSKKQGRNCVSIE